MKKLLFVLMLCATAFTVTAQQNLAPKIKFEKTEYDFGKIPQNKPATYKFRFTNSGNTPLIINSAISNCGCVTPDYTKEPIMPGKKGEITAIYNAANTGSFTKTISVSSNAETVVLTVKGEVKSSQ